MDGLIPVLDGNAMRFSDENTMAREPISSIDLMERASFAVYRILKPRLNKSQRIVIVCGPGNNGGDGWCLARFLTADGFNTVGMDAMPNSPKSEANKINHDMFRKYQPGRISSSESLFDDCDVIIDAVLGSGINKPVAGKLEKLIEQMNQSPAIRYSVDIPSGLFTDRAQNKAPFIKSDLTITIQAPFPSFFFAENQIQFKIADAGIRTSTSSSFFLSPEEPWRRRLLNSIPSKPVFGHKGTSGHIGILGGWPGMSGAVAIAATASIDHGAGLTSVIAPPSAAVYLSNIPKAMHRSFNSDDQQNKENVLSGLSVLCIGPGMGAGDVQKDVLKRILNMWSGPVILDADGLNLLSTDNTIWDLIEPGSVITPHPREFERLFGKQKTWEESLKIAHAKAKEKGIYILLKNKYSALVCPDGEVYYNGSGDAGLSSGGSGDYLSGAIAAWLGRTGNAKTAVIAAAYLCGLKITKI